MVSIKRVFDHLRFRPMGLVWFGLAVLCQQGVYGASEGELSGYYGFGPMEILKIDYQMGAVTAVDINRDGLNDLVVDNNRKSRIELLIQKKDFQPDAAAVDEDQDDINDIFGREKAWRFRHAYLPVDVRVISYVVADLNGDGWKDLAYYSTEGLFIVLQKPAVEKTGESAYDRDPKWQTPVKKDIREGLSLSDVLAAGDLNHDGRSDLALLGSDTVFVFYQESDGRLSEPVRFATAAEKVRRFYLADINGDQCVDLVLVTGDKEYPLRVRLGGPSGLLGPEVMLAMPVPRTVELSTFGRTDSRAMFVMISELSGRILISSYETNGPPDRRLKACIYPFEKSESANKRDYAIADITGDGFDDVIVSDPGQAGFELFRGQSGQGLHEGESFPGLKEMEKLCVCRSGSDYSVLALSRSEKIIGLSRYQNGRITFPSIIEVTGEPAAMDVADVDGDGQSDLIYIARDDPKKKSYCLRTLLNVGGEATAGPELALARMKDQPKDITSADIDHDGRTDVLIVPSYGPLQLVRQVAAGQFEETADTDIHSGLVSKIGPGEFVIAPLGEKGTPAVLLAEKNYARSLYFDPARGWQVIDQYPPAKPGSVIAAVGAVSLHQDHSPVSVLTYDQTGQELNILECKPGQSYQTVAQVPVGSIAVKQIMAGRFDSATANNIMIGGRHQMVVVPMSERAPILQEQAVFDPDIKNGRYGEIAIGDINHDGYADIVVCEQKEHHIEILGFDPQGELQSAMKFKVFESPRGEGREDYRQSGYQQSGEPEHAVIADVTGDGQNDLVVLVHDRIIIYPQE